MRTARTVAASLALLPFLGALQLVSSLAHAEPDDVIPFADVGPPIADIVRALTGDKPVALRSVDTSSIVFRMELDGDIEAAFKPQTKTHPHGYRAEVAAFRIGRALGMTNITPAVPRSVPLDDMKALLVTESRDRWAALSDEIIVSPSQVVLGAATYWIPDMRDLGLATPQGIGHWRRWLSQENGDPPSREKSKVVAAQVSTLIAFDLLIGNRDSFSTSHPQGDKTGRHLFAHDHLVAFGDPLPQLGRLTARLRQVERFSRSFASALRKLDGPVLRAALIELTDPPGFTALTESQIAWVLDRRSTLLSYLAALVDRYGEANVLTFP